MRIVGTTQAEHLGRIEPTRDLGKRGQLRVLAEIIEQAHACGVDRHRITRGEDRAVVDREFGAGKGPARVLRTQGVENGQHHFAAEAGIGINLGQIRIAVMRRPGQAAPVVEIVEDHAGESAAHAGVHAVGQSGNVHHFVHAAEHARNMAGAAHLITAFAAEFDVADDQFAHHRSQ